MLLAGEARCGPSWLRSRLAAAAGIALLLVLAAGAAIAANVALLGYTDHRNDPIGHLSPLALRPATIAKAPTATTTTPVRRANGEDD